MKTTTIVITLVTEHSDGLNVVGITNDVLDNGTIQSALREYVTYNYCDAKFKVTDASAATTVPELNINDLRAFVKRTCHTPLLVAGQFVAVLEQDVAPHMRRTIATEAEMLLAVEHHIRTLQEANTYLRTQLPTKEA